jgi:hypothetical protein
MVIPILTIYSGLLPETSSRLLLRQEIPEGKADQKGEGYDDPLGGGE